MVYFSCGACGQSLKKNQVEKHYSISCFNCNVVSCLDCGKEFFGNDYQNHVKCITEEEKYCGKDFQPKVNKGEVKQEEWVRRIGEIVSQTNVSPELKKLMDKIKTYSNIPRKQKKFENFVKSSFPYVKEPLMKQAWEIFSKAQEKSLANGTSNPQTKENAEKESHPEKRSAEENEVNNSPKKKKLCQNEQVEKAEKFLWEDAIASFINEKGEISIKKLQKKVLALYFQSSELLEKSISKFNKAITNPRFETIEGKVRLKE